MARLMLLAPATEVHLDNQERPDLHGVIQGWKITTDPEVASAVAARTPTTVGEGGIIAMPAVWVLATWWFEDDLLDAPMVGELWWGPDDERVRLLEFPFTPTRPFFNLRSQLIGLPVGRSGYYSLEARLFAASDRETVLTAGDTLVRIEIDAATSDVLAGQGEDPASA